MNDHPIGAIILAILIIPSFIVTAPTDSLLVIYTFCLAMVGAAGIAYKLEQAIVSYFSKD